MAEKKDQYGFKADGVISKSGGGFRDEAVTNEEGMMSEVTASAGAELAAGGAELSADQAQSLYRDGFVRAGSPRSPTLRLTPRRGAGRSSSTTSSRRRPGAPRAGS